MENIKFKNKYVKPFNDLSGSRVGKLLVLSRDFSLKRVYYMCICDCGTYHTVNASNLKTGQVKSCGKCFSPTTDKIGQRRGKLIIENHRREKVKNSFVWYFDCKCDCGNITSIRSTSHAISCGCIGQPYKDREKFIRIRTVHSAMKIRCYNENATNYKNYGGRGIKICERWLSFPTFYKDMEASWFLGATIDRINNNGDYEPSNCRWATMKTQQRNKRKNKLNEKIVSEILNSSDSAKELCKQYNIHEETVRKIRKKTRWA